MKYFGVVARVKAPVGCIGRWINIYKYAGRINSGGAYKKRFEADVIAKNYRHSCVYVHIPVETEQ